MYTDNWHEYRQTSVGFRLISPDMYRRHTDYGLMYNWHEYNQTTVGLVTVGKPPFQNEYNVQIPSSTIVSNKAIFTCWRLDHLF